MGFCRAAVSYDPALPVIGDVVDTHTLVKKQDAAAMTMFHYHLAGMGLEAWDYQDPENADDCVKSVWRMVCYTYFPRAHIGCQEGMSTTYIRPCRSSCQNYVRSCGTECCDESVQCVFTHRKDISAELTITQTGYVPHDGPSSMCTGAAARGRPGVFLMIVPFLAFLVQGFSLSGNDDCDNGYNGQNWWHKRKRALIATTVVLLSATILQGCDVDVPTHAVGNWRAEADYLIRFEFVPPGGSSRSALLNSCSLDMLAQTMQCNGRGVCRQWDDRNLENPTAFCQCDRDWVDPECGTKRKSQIVAYLLSIFLGPFGADLFYLGYPLAGVLKLSTLGGVGIWWIVDIIRIGSAPVEAKTFRVAADLPHWVFVLSSISLAVVIGFLISSVALAQHISARRKDGLRLQTEVEHKFDFDPNDQTIKKLAVGSRGARNYGSMDSFRPSEVMSMTPPPPQLPTVPEYPTIM